MVSATLQVLAIFNKKNPIVIAVKVLEGVLLRQMTVHVGDSILGTITNVEDQQQVEVIQGVQGRVYAIRIDPPEGQTPSVSKQDILQSLSATL